MTEALLELRLPLPPSLNAYYLNAARKVGSHLKSGKVNPRAGATYVGRMIAPEGLAYRGFVYAQVRKGHKAPPRLTGRLSIAVLALPRDLQAFDLDNRFKCLLDSLQRAEAILNDAQFDDIRMVRWNPVAPGWVRLRISRFDPAEAAAFARSMGETQPDLLG